MTNLTQQEIQLLKELNLDQSPTNLQAQIQEILDGQFELSEQLPVEELFADEPNSKSSFIPTSPLEFSAEATAVLVAGAGLWRYYHRQDNPNPNASLYDIKEFFQGSNISGKMNSRSQDEVYTSLINGLRTAQKTLEVKIQPKVYQYGFLK